MQATKKWLAACGLLSWAGRCFLKGRLAHKRTENHHEDLVDEKTEEDQACTPGVADRPWSLEFTSPKSRNTAGEVSHPCPHWPDLHCQRNENVEESQRIGVAI